MASSNSGRKSRMRGTVAALAAIGMSLIGVGLAPAANATTTGEERLVDGNAYNVGVVGSVSSYCEGETPMGAYNLQIGNLDTADHTVAITVSSETAGSVTVPAGDVTKTLAGSFNPGGNTWRVSVTVDGANGPLPIWNGSFTLECHAPEPVHPKFEGATANAFCIDGTTPAANVVVSVNVPEGAPPATVGVYLLDGTPFDMAKTATSSGQLTFTSSILPVGHHEFKVYLNDQKVGHASVDISECKVTPSPEPEPEPEPSPSTPPVTPGEPVQPAPPAANPAAPAAPAAPQVPKENTPRVGATGDVVEAGAQNGINPVGTGFLIGGAALAGLLVAGGVFLQRRRAAAGTR